MSMIKAIYKITNCITNKIYIGQSVHPTKRWREHCRKAEKGGTYPIHLAINKYGKENFNFEILEWTEDYNNKEEYYIAKYNTIAPNGYNILKGGQPPQLYGEDHPNNTLTNEQVNNIIKALQENNLTDRAIAKKFNTTDKIVSDINHGRTHRIDTQYPIRSRHGSQKLTTDQVAEIKFLLENTNISYNEIGLRYGVTKGTIYHINTGRTFHTNRQYPIRSK